MPPSDEENKRPKAHDDVNPFVLFRRFADDQMSTLMNGVFSISSLFGSPSTPPRRSVEDYEKWLQEARESSQRLAREAEEAERIMSVYTRAHKDNQRVVQDPISDNGNEPLRCPYRPAEEDIHGPENPDLDMSHLDDATRGCLSLVSLGLRLPSTVLAAPVLGEHLSTVPVAYLLYSPYSPVRLEQQPHLCDQGARWREAFEDLLAVQSGQKLPAPRCSQRVSESTIDWVRGMIDLAIEQAEGDPGESSNAVGKVSDAVGGHLGLLSIFRHASQLESDTDIDENGDADNDDVVNEGEPEITESDMYDRVFSSQQTSPNQTARTAARSVAHSQPESAPSETDSKKPSILSTLTTTERTTLQDGSVHTKVVLKKRFCDGREESTETVHHQNAVRQTQDAGIKSSKDEDVGAKGKDKGKKVNGSSGWFWS